MKERRKIKWGWLPVIMLLVMVPLVVALNITPIKETVVQNLVGAKEAVDLFSRGKSIVIMCTLPLMWFLWGAGTKKEKYKGTEKSVWETQKVYMMAAGIFVAMTLISTMLSDYIDVALWGYPNRNEGAVVWCSYMMMLIYAMYNMRVEGSSKVLFYGLGIVSIVQLALGVFQYMGQDPIVHNQLMQYLIVPEHLAPYRGNLSSQYAVGTMHGTMENSNFLGSFTAMIVPFFGICFMLLKGWKQKVVSGIFALVALVLLVGSASSAGMVGVAAAAIVGGILLLRVIGKHWKIGVGIVMIIIVALVGVDVVSDGKLTVEVGRIVRELGELLGKGDQVVEEDTSLKGTYKSIVVEGKKIVLDTTNGQLHMVCEGKGITFTDGKGDAVATTKNANGGYTIVDPRFEDVEVNLLLEVIESKTASGEVEKKEQVYVELGAEGKGLYRFKMMEQGLVPYDRFKKQEVASFEVPRVGFWGKEHLGSGRGYIWSTTLPMLKDTLLFGHGPDTYVMTLPQQDTIGKWKMSGNPNLIIDKPHNIYLQIGVNQGVVALGAFLVIVLGFIFTSMRKLICKKVYTEQEVYLLGITLAVVGYLAAGFFNDSIVSVSPIFWVLLGTGFALTSMIKYRKYQVVASVESTEEPVVSEIQEETVVSEVMIEEDDFDDIGSIQELLAQLEAEDTEEE